MFNYIFPFIGINIMALAVFLAVKKRHSTSKFITCLTLGIFFSTVFMVLPTDWGKDVFTEPFYAIVSSILYSLKTLGGRQDVSQIERIALPYILKLVYIAVNYISFVAAPIMASSLILSFFGDTGERMQYGVRFSDNCHIFSELNENSLTLAKGIKNSHKKDTVVFCDTKKVDEKLAEKAKKIGAILLHRSAENMKTDLRHKSYSFYLISDDEDKNINRCISVIKKHREDDRHRITVYAFAQNDTNISTVEAMSCGNVGIRFVDEIVLFCNHLIDRHPLYETARPISDGERLISLLLIGAGRTGTQMLKTAVWYGQIIGYKLKIRVLDNKAEDIKKEFFGACPELESEEYDIKFITADVNHTDFTKAISKHAADTTYAVIAMGDDKLNIAAADKLQGVLRRINRFEKTAPIFARVRSSLMAENLNSNQYLADRNIELFGSIDTIYSEKTLLNTELEKLALAVHLQYYGVSDKPTDDDDYIYALNTFMTSAYNRRSSMASALHFKAKLMMVEAMRAKGMTAEDISVALAENEHIRWMAFTRSIGYTNGTDDEMELYIPQTGRDIDKMAKLHCCLRPWDMLDALSDKYNQLMPPKKNNMDFKKIDCTIVDNLDKIMAKAKTL